MLAYIRKHGVATPDFLKGWKPISKFGLAGGSVHYLEPKPRKQPIIDTSKLVEIDDEYSFYKLEETLEPTDLLKDPKRIYGSPFLMPDGKYWYVPKLRLSPDNSTELPSVLKYDHLGARLEVYEQYKEANELGTKLWEGIVEKNSEALREFNGPVWLAKFLSINYYITEWEVLAFGLYGKQHFGNEFCNHVLDADAWVAFMTADEVKKNK